MSLLIDLFGYLSIIIHGLTITAQSMALGSVLFLALLLRPIVANLGSTGPGIERGCIAIAAWSALALVVCEAATVPIHATRAADGHVRVSERGGGWWVRRS